MNSVSLRRRYFEAVPDVSKADAVEALLLRLSLDSTDEVSELAVSRMLPAVSSWLLRSGGRVMQCGRLFYLIDTC